MKSVIKEICIILLLCVAICLVLGVIFYDYIPTTKVVPSTVEKYTTSETIQEELEQETLDYSDGNTPTETFEITDSDLTLYKKTESYDTGKANPFATYSSESTDNTDEQQTTLGQPVLI
jgi:uncharacterized protein YpuA (DUF1002 family)